MSIGIDSCGVNQIHWMNLSNNCVLIMELISRPCSNKKQFIVCKFDSLRNEENSLPLEMMNEKKIALFLKWIHLFVWVQFQNYSLRCRRQHYRWRAINFHLHDTFVANEHWGFFSMPHLLWHGAFVHNSYVFLSKFLFAGD